VRHAREHDYDLKFKTVLSSIAFVTASQASQRTTYHVLYVRNKIIVLEGFRKEISRLKRAFAMAVIHYCARAIAMMVKKDPEQLEEDLLRLSRKMRGIPVPRLDHSR